MRLLILLIGLCCSVFSQDKSGVSVLPSGKTIYGDYVVFGRNIEISGNVLGDVYVAGIHVLIDGNIQGDVIAACGSLVISGDISGSVRMAGGELFVSGTIGNSCSFATFSGNLIPSAFVGGSLAAITGSLDLSAPVAKQVRFAAGNARLSSSIGENVSAIVGQMRLTSKAEIGGKLTYASSQQALIDDSTHIKGGIDKKPSLIRDLIGGDLFENVLIGSQILANLMNFLYSLGVGLLLLRLFPRYMRSTLVALEKHPVKSLAFGAIALIVLPLLFLILLISIFGIPFALTLLAFNIITFYTAKIVTVLWVSNKWLTKLKLLPNHASTLGLGLAIYFLLALIPIFGEGLSVMTMILGLGASLISVKRN